MGASKIEIILKKYPKEKKHILTILEEINEVNGYVGKEAMIEIAEYLEMSPATIYGTATFYHFINLKPKGKYVIRLCKSVSCELTDKGNVLKALENELDIKVGETTKDKLFTLELTNCMGMCDQGPAMMVNKEIHKKLTPEKIKTIVSDLKKKS